MNFLEKNLEEIIFEASTNELHNRGLYISGKMKRQVKIGAYGICDIISFDRKVYPWCNYLEIDVIELKKEQINLGTFLQALRYAKGIQRYFAKRKFKHQIRFVITLIGSSIDTENDFVYLPDLVNSDSDSFSLYVRFYTYQYKWDGIKFHYQENYSLINEGF